MTILANIIGAAALAAMFVVFYALGVSAGREATQQREEDISMEHTHGGEDNVLPFQPWRNYRREYKGKKKSGGNDAN